MDICRFISGCLLTVWFSAAYAGSEWQNTVPLHDGLKTSVQGYYDSMQMDKTGTLMAGAGTTDTAIPGITTAIPALAATYSSFPDLDDSVFTFTVNIELDDEAAPSASGDGSTTTPGHYGSKIGIGYQPQPEQGDGSLRLGVEYNRHMGGDSMPITRGEVLLDYDALFITAAHDPVALFTDTGNPANHINLVYRVGVADFDYLTTSSHLRGTGFAWGVALTTPAFNTGNFGVRLTLFDFTSIKAGDKTIESVGISILIFMIGGGG